MSEQLHETGGISVETNHIFPVIKRWLYSDKEIFLREIVSNASDAVTKLKRLCSLGQANIEEDDWRITVSLDREARTLTVSDNGIGMSADEVRRYICQIALSGALEFIEKYEGEGESGSGIIGHFGLGFYSAFMVADTVELATRSYTDAPAVAWTCDEAGSYELTDGTRETRGTDVIMHIAEGEDDFLEEATVRRILTTYCAFLPVPVFLHIEGKEGEDEQINDTEPLWQKRAGDCTDEDYRAFYTKVFGDYHETLFHIHINADYPLNFKGILYFPKLNYEYESLEGQVKLYYNQVFVADNIKEVIPEYLLMLRGVLDCPELPLNVSRSYLQNNTYVSKLSAHIVKKVADKLCSLYNTERERFEQIWDDLKVFFEYACLRDEKFCDRALPCALFKTTDGRCVTLEEYADGKELKDTTVYYCTDPTAQAQYISLLTAQGRTVPVLSHPLDTQFISLLEHKEKGKFRRVDAEIDDSIADGESSDAPAALVELFRNASGNEKLEIAYQPLKDAGTPALLTTAEQSRRMNDMMRAYGMADNAAGEDKLVLNAASPLIAKLASAPADTAKIAAQQIWSLALLSRRPLTADELSAFLAQSYDIIEKRL